MYKNTSTWHEYKTELIPTILYYVRLNTLDPKEVNTRLQRTEASLLLFLRRHMDGDGNTVREGGDLQSPEIKK